MMTASAEMQSELQKLEDMQLCYRTLCKLSTGTESTLSEDNLERLPSEYNSVVDQVLKYFSQPPAYQGSCNNITSNTNFTNSSQRTNVSYNTWRYNNTPVRGNSPVYHTSTMKTTTHPNLRDNSIPSAVDDFVIVPSTMEEIASACHLASTNSTWEEVYQANEGAAFI